VIDYTTQGETAPDLSLAAQPAREDIRNALQIALGAEASEYHPGRFVLPLGGRAGIADLLRAALTKLEAGASAPLPESHT
jgi:hypothetical protein